MRSCTDLEEMVPALIVELDGAGEIDRPPLAT